MSGVASSPVAKLVAFALLIVATFGAGAALGAVAGPIDTGDDHSDMGDDHTEGPTTTVTIDSHGSHGDN